jgi:predicted RNA-binding Zn ribbon-like protein
MEPPLVGGNPALDLVNTAEPGRDDLADLDAMTRWATRLDLPAPTAVGPVHALRDAVGALLRDPADGAALTALRDAYAAAVARARLVPDGRRLALRTAPDLADRLAEAAVALLTGPETARIKRCPVDRGGCGWVFLDRTRNASRTWCRMADCGNAVKSKRLTERRRQQRGERR